MISHKNSSLSVGFFLAIRDLKRANLWTTGLIVVVMTLTFFNMLFVGGVLGGLVSGLIGSFRDYYSSDVLIRPSVQKNSIEQTDGLITVVQSLPTYQHLSKRFTAEGLVEAGYRNKLRPSDTSESVGATLVGIDPEAEDKISHLSKQLIAGSYLSPSDVDSVVLGKDLLSKYVVNIQAVTKKLKSAEVGSRVRLTVNGVQKEVTVKGIVDTQNQIADTRVYMVDSALRELLGGTNLNANEIAIDLVPGASDADAKQYILANIPNDDDMEVQTAEEAVPSGSTDVKQTFAILGNMVGGIALVVGSITIFIVIFVNAITRRKFIGILKGIGISARAIEISYVFQALFYAFSGIILGTILIMGFLKPFFDIYPLQLPIAEGHLAIGYDDILIRGCVLMFTALISGFIPAWLVSKQNTLDAILGR